MIRVAIIEDNPTVRQSLETIVGMADDCQCVGAWGAAEEGLQKAPALKPNVLLLDIQLPHMSGVECAERLMERLPDTQIIMVTVYEDPDRIFAALRAGASGYLLKRSAPEQIVAAIREACQGGAPMSAEIARKVIAHFRQPGSAASAVEQLSPREKEVLELLAEGFDNKRIASRLSVSVDAVRWHLKQIYSKLHVHSRTQAALKYHASKTPHLGS